MTKAVAYIVFSPIWIAFFLPYIVVSFIIAVFLLLISVLVEKVWRDKETAVNIDRIGDKIVFWWPDSWN